MPTTLSTSISWGLWSLPYNSATLRHSAGQPYKLALGHPWLKILKLPWNENVKRNEMVAINLNHAQSHTLTYTPILPYAWQPRQCCSNFLTATICVLIFTCISWSPMRWDVDKGKPGMKCGQSERTMGNEQWKVGDGKREKDNCEWRWEMCNGKREIGNRNGKRKTGKGRWEMCNGKGTVEKGQRKRGNGKRAM